VSFDDPNLLAYGGLVPVVRLAERCDLPGLTGRLLRIVDAPNSGGANPAAKLMSLVAAMSAGADSIDDAHRLRHGGMATAFGGARAPSTLGTFLRSFTHGHARQLHAVHRQFLAELAVRTPLLPGAGQVAFIDVDPTHQRVYGRAKQGAQIGRFNGVRTLHPILATVSTPTARPVIAAVRMRHGKAADVRGAASFVAEALGVAEQAGATGIRIVRADAKFYTAAVVAACRRAGAHFSLTTGMNPSIAAAVDAAPADGWTPIRYPNAIEDPDTGELISNAEIAEIPYTAFTGQRKAAHVTARLIVRRVKRLDPHAPDQGELFDAWRHHAVFTDSPFPLAQAEACHRDHAIIEQAIAELKAGPLAHLPSGPFHANSAWAIGAAIAHNLLRAAGALASVFHAKATAATIRAHLVAVPARLSRSARRLALHLPDNWPRQIPFDNLFTATHAPR
jgi:hypothetical protein